MLYRSCYIFFAFCFFFFLLNGLAPVKAANNGYEILYDQLNSLSNDVRVLISKIEELEQRIDMFERKLLKLSANQHPNGYAQDRKDAKQHTQLDVILPEKALVLSEYDKAVGMLSNFRYIEAESVLLKIIEIQNPDGILDIISNSWYRLGEISEMQKDMKNALFRFQQARKTNAASSKIGLISFKIAGMLKELGNKISACSELKDMLQNNSNLSLVLIEASEELYSNFCES